MRFIRQSNSRIRCTAPRCTTTCRRPAVRPCTDAAAQVLDAGAALAHRVAAADQVDDRLADDVEAAALRELEQGAVALAATHLLWAWPLSSAPGQQERRLLMAMRLLLADGQTARAAGLRERAMACPPTPLRNLVLGNPRGRRGRSDGRGALAAHRNGPGRRGHRC